MNNDDSRYRFDLTEFASKIKTKCAIYKQNRDIADSPTDYELSIQLSLNDHHYLRIFIRYLSIRSAMKISSTAMTNSASRQCAADRCPFVHHSSVTIDDTLSTAVSIIHHQSSFIIDHCAVSIWRNHHPHHRRSSPHTCTPPQLHHCHCRKMLQQSRLDRNMCR